MEVVDKKAGEQKAKGGIVGSGDGRRIVVTAVVAAIAGALIAAVCCIVVPMMGQQQGVAAMVDGTAIMESDVTDAVAQIREAVDATDDEAWMEYLDEQGVTPATVRLNVIQNKESTIVVENVAKELGVTVSESDVDAAVAKAKDDGFEGVAFSSYLRGMGQTEEQYRDEARVMLLEDGISAKLAVEYDLSDETEISSMFNKYMADRFAHIQLEMNAMPDGLPYDVK